MLSPEIVEEAHRCADQDGETRDGHAWFSLEFEEGEEHRQGNTTATNASDCAQGHDEAEHEDTYPLERFLREYLLVFTFII